MTTSKRKGRGKKQKREDSRSPSVEKDAQQPSMAKAIPRRYTRRMAKQKRPPAKADRSEISPIEVEEDNPTKSPDLPTPNSPPPVSPLIHQMELGEDYFDTFLTQFEYHQQPTISNDNLYEKPCKNPVMTSKNPSLCYDNITKEASERQGLLKKLKQKNKQLKKEMKEYQVLTHVIQQ